MQQLRMAPHRSKLGHKTPPPILRNCRDAMVSSHGNDYCHHEFRVHPHPQLDSMRTGERTSGGSRSKRREVISRMRQRSNSFTKSHNRPCIAAKSLKSILLCDLGAPMDPNALQSFKVECDLNPASSHNLIFRSGGRVSSSAFVLVVRWKVRVTGLTWRLQPQASLTKEEIWLFKQLFLLHVLLIIVLPYMLSWGDVS